MKVGTKVRFTAPQNVNQQDHGLDPGQVVEGVVTVEAVEGPEWVEIEYDGGRWISAHISELEEL